jgi:hypothetical protein
MRKTAREEPSSRRSSILWPRISPSDPMVDWISAIIASIFGAGETVEEILEEE